MLKEIFKSIDYDIYCKEFSINSLIDISVDLNAYGKIEEKRIKKWNNVDPDNKISSPPELDDLIRLHFLIKSRKVRTVMEFGLGKSTSIIIDALSENKREYWDEVNSDLRVSNPFQLHSIDNNQEWLNMVKDTHKNVDLFYPHLCNLQVNTFKDRLCTYYEGIPNIRPDFIYLDGPDQFSANGDIRGLTTNHKDRMPMAADILVFEHFLEPGTMILIDGRTANARFLKCNLQRNWDYFHFEDYDQHIFLLDESPLGLWNKAALTFTSNG